MKSIDFEALNPTSTWEDPHWNEIHISATITYYTPGPYGPMQHQYGKVTYWTREDLRRAICNADDILNTRGAQHVVVDAEHRIAYQVSGYNARRGAFVDVIPREKLLPYLDTFSA